uniref:Uncharacterized protein n=1 Tax=Calcidiscus leptoporus TaxID=127549 RepID=A0A7S0NMS6_9EUKA
MPPLQGRRMFAAALLGELSAGRIRHLAHPAPRWDWRCRAVQHLQVPSRCARPRCLATRRGEGRALWTAAASRAAVPHAHWSGRDGHTTASMNHARVFSLFLRRE